MGNGGFGDADHLISLSRSERHKNIARDKPEEFQPRLAHKLKTSNTGKDW